MDDDEEDNYQMVMDSPDSLEKSPKASQEINQPKTRTLKQEDVMMSRNLRGGAGKGFAFDFDDDDDDDDSN